MQLCLNVAYYCKKFMDQKLFNTEYATSLLSHTTGDFEFQLPDIPELVNEPDCEDEKGEETLEQAKQKLRRQRGKRARGLSFLAEDVIER